MKKVNAWLFQLNEAEVDGMLCQLILHRVGERFGRLARLPRWLHNEHNTGDFSECGAEDEELARKFREKHLTDVIDGVGEEEADLIPSGEVTEVLTLREKACDTAVTRAHVAFLPPHVKTGKVWGWGNPKVARRRWRQTLLDT